MSHWRPITWLRPLFNVAMLTRIVATVPAAGAGSGRQDASGPFDRSPCEAGNGVGSVVASDANWRPGGRGPSSSR